MATPATPLEGLPPEAVLKYYRAMGLEAFFDLLGWEHESRYRVMVPVKGFTPMELWEFCGKYEVPVDNVEGDYIGPNQKPDNVAAIANWWKRGTYRLYLWY